MVSTLPCPAGRLSATCALALAIVGCGGEPYPSCDDDEDCLEFASSPEFNDRIICVDAMCTQCRSDNDCQAGFECVHNACAAIPDYCAEIGACLPPGRLCVLNRWRPGCSTTCGDCGAGMECNSSGQCEESAECRLDSDCYLRRGPQMQCQNRQCVAVPVCTDRELETIYFEYGESAIRPDQQRYIEANADCLFAFPRDVVRIAGHCDHREGEPDILAEARAIAVRDALMAMGVDGERLVTASDGQSLPTCQDETEECWQRNRRASLSWE